VMPCVAVRCNVLQCMDSRAQMRLDDSMTAHYNTLQHTCNAPATHTCDKRLRGNYFLVALQHTTTHLQHTCNTPATNLKLVAVPWRLHCNTLQNTPATSYNKSRTGRCALWLHCNTPATHYNTPVPHTTTKVYPEGTP